MNRRAFAFYLVLSALSLLLVACVTRAAAEAHGVAAVTGGDGDVLPDVGAGAARWWQTGALTMPITLAAFVLLVALERLSRTRWYGLGWLRQGSVRAYLSISVGAVVGLLPQVADGSVTWGGLAVALSGGLIALRPGGGEQRAPVAVGQEPPS